MSTIIRKTRPEKLISLANARNLINGLRPLDLEKVSLHMALARRVGTDILANADCPSIDASLKDGFAVRSQDVATASPQHPVPLRVVDMVAAGETCKTRLEPGQAIRIMTGAPLPHGADAVLSAEFTRQKGKQVHALADAHPGRNILYQGSDVTRGKVLVQAGSLLTPARMGLLAAGGVHSVLAYRQPRVMVVATGSELVEPMEPITPGRIAASNMVSLVAELTLMGLAPDSLLIRDDLHCLKKQLAPLMGRYDCVLTCGGVLDGDKDFIMKAMRELAIEPLFQRVRIGPGKGVCMGQSREAGTIFINLPGGPPSNHVAFTLLAKPALQRLGGMKNPFAHAVTARLAQDIKGQQDWTQVFYAHLFTQDAELWVEPVTGLGRMAAMAEADCLIEFPEGTCYASQGSKMKNIWKIK